MMMRVSRFSIGAFSGMSHLPGWLSYLLLALATFSLTGCGGGGGGGDGAGGGEPFEAVLVPVRITGESLRDGNGIYDGIFASVRGPGITGGWVVDQTGNRIPSSDLQYQYPANARRYQFLTWKSQGGWAEGAYTLAYMENGQTKELKRDLRWTILPAILRQPSYNWIETTSTLQITPESVPGDTRYQLELWSTTLLQPSLVNLTVESPSTVLETWISQGGTYEPRVVANQYQGGTLSAKIIYVFRARDY